MIAAVIAITKKDSLLVHLQLSTCTASGAHDNQYPELM